VRLTAVVSGRVQGVGFRWWVARRAGELGLVGWAENRPDGTVKVLAEGPEAACRELVDSLRGSGTPGRVTNVVDRWSEPLGDLSGFALH